MKKINLLICFLAVSYALIAQNNIDNNKTGVIVASDFRITRPIRDIFTENPVDESKFGKAEKKESEDRKHRIPQKFPLTVEDGLEYGNDPASLQTDKGVEPGRAPITNWAGQTAAGFRPYDPSGGVGPNHYVQMINSTTFKVYNKVSGAVTLTGTFGNLWTPATPNDGDPIVLYDKAADRWFLAQFGTSGNKIYIAISTTGDPTGSYYTYTYTSPQFPDYLKFSVWADGYFMTSNQPTQKVFCFDRAAMLVGTPGARSIYVNYSPPDGGGFFCPLPGDASDGTLPSAGTPCPIFSYSDNGWGAGFSDAINIYNMSVNWVPVTPTATITLAATIPTAAFDASYDANWNDVSQPGTTQKLDGIGGVLTYRAQWRSWAGYNTTVLNWGVKISASQRSIKWCELRQNQSTGVWSLFQEGIYTPDAYTRWLGSISMDINGGIALCYAKSGASTVYPSLGYAGRRSCDPPGTLPISETIVIAGSGSQTGTNRFGDYSQTTLDPDGITYWHTAEYIGAAGAAKTQIYSFQLTSCTNTAVVNIIQTGGTNPACTGSTNTFTATPTNGGTTPVYQWKVNGVNAGTNSPTFTTSALTNGQIVTCVMTSNLAGVLGNPATSNAISMTISSPVTPALSIAVTTGTNPTCSGSMVIFTATPTNGGTTPSYQWKVNGSNAGTNSSTFSTTSLTNGQVVTCVLTSNALCASPTTATSNEITMTVTAVVNPTVSIAQTAGTSPLCTGGSATFTATVANGTSPSYQWKVDGVNAGTNSSTFTTSTLTNGQAVSCVSTMTANCSSLVINTLGTGTGLNPTATVATSGLGNAYPTYYGNGRQQYLIRSSELTALGFTAGNINSTGFTINGTTGNPATLNGYTIKIATTAATVLTTTFQTPTFTTVFGPVNYTPVLNSLNTHTFAAPFAWNGSSNIVIDICFANSVVGTVAYQNYQSTSSFVSTSFYQADNAGGAGACSQATANGGTGSMRPNIRFSIGSSTATATSNSLTMTVNSSVSPLVVIALTSGTNPQCAGASVTFTATPTNGGTSPSYQWKVAGVNSGTNSPTFTTSTLSNGQAVTCVMTSNLSCASPTTATSGGITMGVNPIVTPSVSIALTAGSNPQCAGASSTFTASPTNGGVPSYQWKVNNVNAGTNNPVFTTSTLTNGQNVTCVMTSTASCATPTTATSGGITMSVNPVVSPSVSIALTSGNNPQCAGSSATFTATPANGGSPSYQWKVNNVNAGTNNPVFTTSTLTNGQNVTCVMTSTASCATPTTATSGGITMSVNPVVTPSVSIALTSGNNPQCAGASATFTATPTNGGTPTYQWKVNNVNAGNNSPTFTTTTLINGQNVTCVMTSTASCATPTTATSGGITMIVNPAVTPTVSIALTSGNNPQCEGSSATFTATPVNGGSPSYQWKVDNVNAGSNSPTFTTTTLINGQNVTCVMTSNASCANPLTATSGGITMNINPVVTPGVSITLTSGSNPQCAGSSATFTATPVNGGSPSYQWKVNNVNDGSNSPTFTTSSLTNGQNITCEMTSTVLCANPALATSGGIIMTVNPNVTPSVSIALTTGNNPQCDGQTATFTATPVNGGVAPSYQWKVNGTNSGVNSDNFTSTSLNDDDEITVEMISNANCISGNPAMANSYLMNIIPSPLLNSFTPSNGNAGEPVTISGAGFTGASAVTFNGISSVYTVDNDNQITATIPAGTTTGYINVTTTCGSVNSLIIFGSTGTVILNLKVFIEGFYRGAGEMAEVVSPNVSDTIMVSLASTTPPYSILFTDRKIINKTGHGSFEFPAAVSGNSYFIVINHRNTIETWSKVPVLFTLPVNSFDFTIE